MADTALSPDTQENNIPELQGTSLSVKEATPTAKIFHCICSQSACEVSYYTQLEELKRSIKVKGFREGKVPNSYVESEHSQTLIQKTIEHAINHTISEILKSNTHYILNSSPQVTNIDLSKSTVEKWHDKQFEIECNIEFELVPEPNEVNLSEIKLSSFKVELSDEEVSKELMDLAEKNATPQDAGSQHKAQNGDILTIDFVGRIDGEEFPGGKSDNYSIKLGSKSFIDNFEDQLVGSRSEDSKTVKVTFPIPYQNNPKLEGKEATFDVTIKSIKTIAEEDKKLDDNLAKKLSFESLNTLKKDIRDKAHEFYKNTYRDLKKGDLLKEISSKLTFEIPKRALQETIDNLTKHKKTEEFKKTNPDSKSPPTPDEISSISLNDKEIQKIEKLSQDRLRISYYLMDFGRKNNVSLEESDIQNFILETASNMNIDPSSVFEFYKSNQGYLERIKANLLEFKIFNEIYKHINVQYNKTSRDQAESIIKDAVEQNRNAIQNSENISPF